MSKIQFQLPDLQDDKEFREEAIRFWFDIYGWPQATSNLMFLGHAINILGKAYFGIQWTEFEFVEIWVPYFRDEGRDVIPQGSYLDLYLQRFSQIAASEYGERIDPLDAYKILGQPYRDASFDRAQLIISIFISACLRGELQTFKQRIGGGGPFEAMADYEWTSEGAPNWFLFCHEGPHSVPPNILKKNNFVLPSAIFVDRESLWSFRMNFRLFKHTPDHFHFVSEGSVSADSSVKDREVALGCAPARSRPLRSSPKQIGAVVRRSITFFAQKRYLFWSKDEAEDQLREILGTTRSQWQNWYDEFADADTKKIFSGKRGPRGPKNINRNKELEEFRDIFLSGNWEK